MGIFLFSYWIIAVTAFGIAWGAFIILGLPIVYGQVAIAIAIAIYLKKTKFFVFFEAALLPTVIALLSLGLSPWFYGFVFFSVFFTFSNVFTERVPLFISTDKSLLELKNIVQGKKNFIDLGCGTGRVLFFMVDQCPNLSVVGVENSLVPYLIAYVKRFFCKHRSRVTLIFGSMWRVNICSSDCVYVYLSPAPMKKIWEKFSNEAKCGAILISNTFLVPNVPYDEIYHPKDKIGSRIYIWKNEGQIR